MNKRQISRGKDKTVIQQTEIRSKFTNPNKKSRKQVDKLLFYRNNRSPPTETNHVQFAVGRSVQPLGEGSKINNRGGWITLQKEKRYIK